MVKFVDPFCTIAKVSNRMGAQAVSFLEAFITGEDKMLVQYCQLDSIGENRSFI